MSFFMDMQLAVILVLVGVSGGLILICALLDVFIHCKKSRNKETLPTLPLPSNGEKFIQLYSLKKLFEVMLMQPIIWNHTIYPAYQIYAGCPADPYEKVGRKI